MATTINDLLEPILCTVITLVFDIRTRNSLSLVCKKVLEHEEDHAHIPHAPGQCPRPLQDLDLLHGGRPARPLTLIPMGPRSALPFRRQHCPSSPCSTPP
ncbi:hypothetical protein ACFX2B_007889 [Malus domestica]